MPEAVIMSSYEVILIMRPKELKTGSVLHVAENWQVVKELYD